MSLPFLHIKQLIEKKKTLGGGDNQEYIFKNTFSLFIFSPLGFPLNVFDAGSEGQPKRRAGRTNEGRKGRIN